ncbi:AfsR/SARP family transcriptional regulator [Saccharothrix sp. ALI-22-I]|uniref:AfsR/SARP family transcriptional regulator n=1 Tax=Saccharothrix sp. ALI-22-I TaxID=1933778 RepID=UPI00117A36AD|nr:winged helix-turn-helix domain-containing protein [Saccharothrix sp. ALI-22-I]
MGPVEVLSPGSPVNIGGPKPKALLAALMLEPRQVVSIDRLVDLIRDENPPQSAVALVHTYVSALRRKFAEIGADAALRTRAPGYVLDVDPADVDIVEFTRTVASARRAEQQAEHSVAAQLYQRALGLWRVH